MKHRMHFSRGAREEPEINLIPFIDVLLVVLIFLMLTTTYSKFTEMQLRLPTADVDAQRDYPKEVIVAVSSDGRYSVNRTLLPDRSVETVAAALASAAGGNRDNVVIISADASAAHQSVITVMEAARRSGLMQITFATQSTAKSGR
jgi:biopolymer transport protein ExbD